MVPLGLRWEKGDSRHGQEDIEEEAAVRVRSVGGSSDQCLQSQDGQHDTTSRAVKRKKRTLMTSTRSSSTRRKIDPSKATGTFVARTASSFAMARDRLGTGAEGVSKSQ